MFKLLVDEEINLVFLQSSLANELFALVDGNREYLGQWMPWVKSTKSVADTESFIELSVISFAKGESLVCAIEYKGKLGGVISYNEISESLRKVVLGYWISAHLQGKGIINRACQKLIEYAFTELEMEKVEIKVATKNLPSRNVCEKLSCTLEGEVSNSECLNGTIVTHAVYAIHANRI